MRKILVLGILGACCFGGDVFCVRGEGNYGAVETPTNTYARLDDIRAAIAQARLGNEINIEQLDSLPRCVSETCKYLQDVVRRREQLEDEAGRIDAEQNVKDDFEFLNACDTFFEKALVTTYADISDYENVMELSPYPEKTTKALLTLLLTCGPESMLVQTKTLDCDAAGVKVLHDLINGELSQLRPEMCRVKVNCRVMDRNPIQDAYRDVLRNCNCSFYYGENTLGAGDIEFLESAKFNERLDELAFSLSSFVDEGTRDAFATQFSTWPFKLRLYHFRTDANTITNANTILGLRSVWFDIFGELGLRESDDLFTVYGETYGEDDPCVVCNMRFCRIGMPPRSLVPQEQASESSSMELDETCLDQMGMVIRIPPQIPAHMRTGNPASDIKCIEFNDSVIDSFSLIPIVWTKTAESSSRGLDETCLDQMGIKIRIPPRVFKRERTKNRCTPYDRK